MTSQTPARVTIRCADSAGNLQHLHVGHTKKGLIAAGRGGGQTLHFTVPQCTLLIVAIASHLQWVTDKQDIQPRPLRLTIDCFGPRGSLERAHIESDDRHVLVLREGGIFLHLHPRAATHALQAISTHLHWVMPRWVS